MIIDKLTFKPEMLMTKNVHYTALWPVNMTMRLMFVCEIITEFIAELSTLLNNHSILCDEYV